MGSCSSGTSRVERDANLREQVLVVECAHGHRSRVKGLDDKPTRKSAELSQGDDRANRRVQPISTVPGTGAMHGSMDPVRHKQPRRSPYEETGKRHRDHHSMPKLALSRDGGLALRDDDDCVTGGAWGKLAGGAQCGAGAERTRRSRRSN